MSINKTLKEKYDKYIINSYSRFDAAIEKGKGATAYDGDKKYIDFGSGIGVNALGYCDDGWAKAVCEQAKTLSHCSNLYYSHPQAELAELLCKASGFDKVLFCNSGAEANEALIKVARKYSFDKYSKERTTIVSLKNSFHGRTVTTLTATGQDVFHNYFFPFTEGFKYAAANDIKSVKEALTDDVCAIIMEPIQGEGGVLTLEKSFVKEVAAICEKKDILLLFDEVQTGIGRTGKLFGYENFDVKADAVSCAKAIAGGLPMGALLVNKKLSGVFTPGTHGTTFGGNPIVAAGACEVIKRVANKEFLDEVNKKGTYFRDKLSKIDGISEIRGLGLMMGFEIDGIDSKKLVSKACDNGLLALTAKNSVRFLPPLTITKSEIDEGIKILLDTVNEVAEEENQ